MGSLERVEARLAAWREKVQESAGRPRSEEEVFSMLRALHAQAELEWVLGVLKEGEENVACATEVSPPGCPSCGHPVLEEQRFCTGCGKPLSNPSCPGCQAPVQAGQHFCVKCGQPLEDSLPHRQGDRHRWP